MGLAKVNRHPESGPFCAMAELCTAPGAGITGGQSELSKTQFLPPEELQTFEKLSFRYITINDQSRPERDAWIASVSENIQYYLARFEDTHPLSSANPDYDILIISGNDAARVAKFIKANAALIGNRPRVALVSFWDPRRRAQVLNAGIDDVLDCSRMSPMEGMLRLSALWRRHQLVAQAQAERAEATRILAEFTKSEKSLNASEARVLSKLSENIGKSVSYIKLCDIASNNHESITLNHLKVIISNLRKKIASCCDIRSVNSYGYALFHLDAHEAMTP
jgi:DNA-binding response OmpR family regulator